MLWFLLYLALIGFSSLGARAWVPVEHRRRYAASQEKNYTYYAAACLFCSIPVMAAAQAILAALRYWPLWLRLMGSALIAGGGVLGIWAFRINPSLVANVQMPDQIVSHGVYRLRHPLYAGRALMAIGAFFLLGQDIAVIPLGLYLGILIHRVRVENKLLHS